MSSKKISLADWQQQLQPGTEKTPQASVTADNLVYSTATGSISSTKPEKAAGTAYSDGAVRIRRETKGRNGKAVLTISGIAESHQVLEDIAVRLKKKCACGGAVKDGIIEIQGDKRELVETFLQQAGYTTKWAGG